MAAMNELIQVVKNHAVANYEFDGWDYLVECWSDEDIAEMIGDAKTPEEAIKRCLEHTLLWEEQRDEAVKAGEWQERDHAHIQARRGERKRDGKQVGVRD